MKILVPVKRVIDYNVKPRVKSDGSGVLVLDDDQRRAVMHGVIDAVHHDRGDAEVVFDTNRRWLLRAEQLVALYPLCRFIITVRDPARVVSSLERARRSLTFRQSKLFDPDTTLAQRVNRLMSDDGNFAAVPPMLAELIGVPSATGALATTNNGAMRVEREAALRFPNCRRPPADVKPHP